MLSSLVGSWRAPRIGRVPVAPAVEEPRHILLPSAYLCQDCNAVGNQANRCPACASEVLMGLSAILNRGDETPSSAGCWIEGCNAHCAA